MPAVRRTPFIELFWRIHRSVFRASGGRLGTRVGPLPVLLLSVRGRKSGVARDVLLNHIRDGSRYAVFASYTGEEREPPWWLNLRDAGSEATKRDAAFAEYGTRTTRRIALVVLERL